MVLCLVMGLLANQCLGQCVCPFVFFAAISLYIDLITMITVLIQEYPNQTASEFFSISCPENISLVLLNGTLLGNGITQFNITSDAQVEVPQDYCDIDYLLGNIALVVSLVLDCLATALGVAMYKTATALVSDVRAPIMGGGLDGPPGVAANAAPGGFSGTQRGSPQPGAQFQAFQGRGQVLG